MKLFKILFFILASVPSRAELSISKQMRSEALEEREDVQISFRNVSAISRDDSTEEADAFIGAVPENYKERYPKVPVMMRDELDKKYPVEEAKSEQPETKGASKPGKSMGMTEDTPETPEQVAAKEERARIDEGARGASLEQLKQALDQIQIKYPANVTKAKALKLYLARP